MMPNNLINDLNIDLIYVDSAVKEEWTFSQLDSGEGFISPEELNLEKFYSAMGGMEFRANRYLIFYRNFSFHDLTFPLLFLLESIIVLIDAKDLLEDEIFEDFFSQKTDSQIVSSLKHINNDWLLIKKRDLEYLEISYISDKGESDSGRYFENVSVSTIIWMNATYEALSSYFNIIEHLAKMANVNIESSDDTLIKYLRKWKELVLVFNSSFTK